jgi:hypothetical protein
MRRSEAQLKITRFSVTDTACRSVAITMHHRTDEQILAQVEALLS